MGNGPAKGLPPSGVVRGVVTIVLAGGRIEEFKKSILAGDIMLRYPRHHVVRPDFFRSSPVTVLKPEEVLMPGHKFYLVPFHTVHQKLSRNVEVLHSSSNPTPSVQPGCGYQTSAASTTARLGQPEAAISLDINRFRKVPVGRPRPVGSNFVKKDLPRVVKSDATRSTMSPAGRAPVLRKGSPTTSLHDRRSPPYKENSRIARKRHSGDSDDYARMTRMALQSSMRIDSTSGSSAEFRENESSGDSSDLFEIQAFRSVDLVACAVSIASPVLVTKEAPSADLSRPEYEAFETSFRFSGELSFQKVSEVTEQHESFEAMDFNELEKIAIEQFLPTRGTLVKQIVESFEAWAYLAEKESKPESKISLAQPISPETEEWVEAHESFEAMDCSEPEKSSSEPPLRIPTPSRDGYALVLSPVLSGMTERKDHSRSGDSATPSPEEYASVLSGMKESKDTSRGGVFGQDHQKPSQDGNVFPYASVLRNHTKERKHNSRDGDSGLDHQTPFPDGSVSVVIGMKVQGKDNSRGGDSSPDHQIPPGDGDAEPSVLSGTQDKKGHSQGDDSGRGRQALSRDAYPASVLGGMNDRKDHSQRGDSDRLDHQTRKEDLSSFNKPPRTGPTTVEMELKQQSQSTIKMAAGDAQQAMSYGGRKYGSRQQASVSGEKKGGSQPEQERSSNHGRSEQRTVPQQKQEMEDQTPGGLKGQLQQIHKGAAGNNKFEVNAAAILDNGSLSKAFEQVTPTKPKLNPVPGPISKGPSVAILKQQTPGVRQRFIENLCFSSSKILQSPLNVQAAGGSTEFKQMKAKLKLIDHLKLDPSPPPCYVQKLYEQSPIHGLASSKVKRSALRRRPRLPIPPRDSGTVREIPKAPEGVAAKVQLSDALKNQLNPSILHSNDAFNHIGVRPSIEEKFLKVPPVSFFRNRRIGARRRIHTMANWRPRLSPLVEFSP